MKKYSKEEKRRVLQAYLGELFQIYSKDEAMKFEKKLPTSETFTGMIEHPRVDFLKKVASYILTRNGYINYSFIYSFYVVEHYFDNKEQEHSFYIIDPAKFLVVLHLKSTFVNKRLEELLQFLIDSRLVKGLDTLILAQESLKLNTKRYSL